MSKIIDKRTRADLLRKRLAEAMQRAGSNQTALARAVGVDRSTISQLLKDTGARLPNAQLVGSCAQALGVSSDWLLGLSDRPESAADLLATSLTLTEAPRALVDEQIFRWHREAEGYKIRHVPAALPDMLKTRAVLEWEYGPHLGRTTEQAINASEDRLDWMRASKSDYEIAFPLYEIESFAEGVGYYAGIPAEVRRAQLRQLAELSATLYPRLRIYLFDARRLYSAPVVVFGPLLAVLYLGRNYLAFRDTERVTAITRHFDHLVKEASITARALPDHVTALEAKVGHDPRG
ncbi:helix-turn-helix domain-containing protein [Mameliella sp.]|uniref:helix-turn-helix domain-containing protein n=1 Tax=Mameliella sp. TaxID=1924940 RepID=UPI003BADA265